MRTAAVCPTCATYTNASCIIYTGPYLSTLNINTLESMHTALLKVEAWALVNQGGGGGTGPTVPSVMTSDINVVLYGGKTLGKYVNGDTIPCQGWSFERLIRDIATDTTVPVIVPPTFSNFTVSNPNIVEVGTTLSGSKSFTWSLVLNGNIIPTVDLYDITSGNTLLSGTPNDGQQAHIITSTTLLVEGQTQSWRAIANVTGASNVNSGTFAVTARYQRYWAPVATLPTSSTNGAANRIFANTLNKGFQTPGVNTFTYITGTVYNTHVILLPPGKTITSVIDVSNYDANLTVNYILSLVTVKDAAGTDRIYNMYTYTTGIAYPTSANHIITTT